MGLQNRAQGNYVRISKEGKFYLGKDKENPYDELTGTITDLSFKDDEFEGQKIRKLVITLNDEEKDYILSFAFDSSYASTVVSFLKNADLSQPVTLVPISKTEGEKTSRSMLVKQNGSWLKSYYTKDESHGQPAMKRIVKKSGKVEWDKEEFLDFRENVIMNELRPLLKGGKVTKRATVPATTDADVEDVEDDSEENDLPF
jgi:hypothetical protein